MKYPNRVRIVNQLYIADIMKRIQCSPMNLDVSIRNFQTNPSCDTFAELLNDFNALVEPRDGQIVFHKLIWLLNYPLYFDFIWAKLEVTWDGKYYLVRSDLVLFDRIW